MKIVIVSHSTFPHNSPRANRTDELARQLAKDHDVTLYVLTGAYDYSDYIKTTGVQVKSLGSPKAFRFDPIKISKASLGQKILYKLFHRYFEYPYIELAYLTNKALKKESDIDLLITIAVPYPIHWGAAFHRSKNKDKLSKTVWVADCGDPYMGNPFHNKPFYFGYVEKWFCKYADFLSVPFEGATNAYYPECQKKINVIPQGFDLTGFLSTPKYKENKVPTFIYAGTFYEDLRDPRPLLEHLVTIEQPFKFIIHSKNTALINSYKSVLGNKLEVHDYIPRPDLIKKMSQCDFLINIENRGNVQAPSKLIDYILSKRPVLSIDTSNKSQMKMVDNFLIGDYSRKLELPDASVYDIKNVAKQFTDLVI